MLHINHTYLVSVLLHVVLNLGPGVIDVIWNITILCQKEREHVNEILALYIFSLFAETLYFTFVSKVFMIFHSIILIKITLKSC